MYLKTEITRSQTLRLACSPDHTLAAYVRENIEEILHAWQVKSFEAEASQIDVALAKMAMRQLLQAFWSAKEPSHLQGLEVSPEKAIRWISALRQTTIELWTLAQRSFSVKEAALVADFHAYIDKCILGSFTELRQARERQVEHARELIVHDLMTPIGAMMLSAQCFQIAKHDELAQGEAVEVMVRSGHLVSRIAKEASEILAWDARLQIKNSNDLVSPTVKAQSLNESAS